MHSVLPKTSACSETQVKTYWTQIQGKLKLHLGKGFFRVKWERISESCNFYSDSGWIGGLGAWLGSHQTLMVRFHVCCFPALATPAHGTVDVDREDLLCDRVQASGHPALV